MERLEGSGGRFLPRRLVGEGGSGRVWLVDDARTPGEPLALKELARSDADGSHADRLRREFAALAALHHPGIVEVHEFIGEPGAGQPRFTLEFIRGRGLVDAIVEEGPTGFLELTVQALRTLHFLHGLGLVHRDIKPDNILVRDRAKLGYRLVFVDFGLALLAGEEPDNAARMQGTLPFMAPELLGEGAPGPRSDLYALGAVLHQGLTGRPPFEYDGQDLSRFVEQVQRGRRARPALDARYPGELRAWLEQLLAPDPRDRPAAAAEALAALDRIFGSRHLADDEATRAARLRSGPPAEREGDVARIWEGLDPTGGPGILWLTGGPGSGKSRVLRWIEAEAVLGGWEVVQRRRLSAEGLEALRGSARVRPTLLLIDDIDQAGEGTARQLRRVALEGDAPSLKVLVAVRPGSLHHPALRELLDRSDRIELAALDDRGVAAMATRALARPVSDAQVVWLREASEGSPAVVEALLTAGSWASGEHARDAGRQVAPGGNVTAVLSDDARRWAETLAVVEEGSDDRTLAGLAEMESRTALHAAEEAAGCGLALREDDRWRIESRASASRIRDGIDPPRLRRLYRAAAESAEGGGEDDAWRRYRLWRGAAEAGRAVEAALDGAAEADRRDDPAEAAYRYGRALSLIERHDPRRRDVRLKQAEASMRAGQFAAALRAYGAARRLARTDHERLEAMAGQSHGLTRAARFRRALAVAEETRLLAERLDEPVVLARASKDAGVVLARMGHEERAIPLLRRARDLLHDAGLPLAEAEALQSLAACRLRLEDPGAAADYRRCIELYREAAEDHDRFAVPELKARIGLARVHARAGAFDEATGELERVREAASRQGQTDLEETVLSRLADIATDRGRLDRAIVLASHAADLAQRLGDANVIVVDRCRLADAQIRAGLAGRAARHLRELRDSGLEHVEPDNVAFLEMLLASALLEDDADPDVEPKELLAGALRGCRRRRKRRSWLLALTAELERRGHLRCQDPVAPVLEEYRQVVRMDDRPPEPEIRIRAALAEGDPAGAAALAEEHDAPGFAARCWAMVYAAERRAGNVDAAEQARQRGREQLDRAAGRIEDAETRRSLRERRCYAGLDGSEAADGDASRLSALYEMIRVLNAADDDDALLESILDMALQAIRAERGMILIKSEDGFDVRLARGLERETVRDAENYSHRVVAEAGRGRSLLAVDAGTDQRFRDLDSVSLYGIRSLMCVPLRSRGKIVGTVYLDSRTDGGLFTEDDLRFLEAFADHAALALQNVRHRVRLEQENRRLRETMETRSVYAGIVGRSPAMQQVFDLIEKVAQSDLPVLILGESGTGKELVARAVHRHGPRRERIFLSENCAAIPESLLESELFGHVMGAFTGAERDRPGLFEQAHRGSLFLDEVGDMAPAMQAKLLRVLEEGELRRVGGERTLPIDVRVIAATHRDLEQEVRAGRFRLDLLYRLRVLSVELPPLRDRPEDIPLLVDHFLEGIGEGTIDEEVRSRLLRHRWPGNVRELENAVQRLVLLAAGRPAGVEHVRQDAALSRALLADEGSAASPISLAAGEREQLSRALAAAGGNRSAAARLLGISRATLYRKLGRHGL